MAMCLPTSVSLITHTFPRGHWRTTCFAMNGMAQPLGYALGLVLGGVFTDTVGWRAAYWIMAGLTACVSVMAVWALPVVECRSARRWTRRLGEDVDWVGAVGLSASLGVLMYVLASKYTFPLLRVCDCSLSWNSAVVTSDYRNISGSPTIALLPVALVGQ